MAVRFTLQRSFLRPIRNYVLASEKLHSTVANAYHDVHPGDVIDPQWHSAKPYSSIPTPTIVQLYKGFKKGGRYADLSITEVHKRWREDFGKLVRVRQWGPGKSDIILSFDPEDYAKLFRSEGVWPFRRSLDTMAYYRQKIRPELFKNAGGLVMEQGEKWQQMRTMLNPVMMQPKTIRLYVEQVDEVAREFMTLVTDLRDEKHELPNDFDQWLNRWALETMGVLALNTRFGMMKGREMEQGNAIIKMVRDIFDLTYRLDIEPSIWKIYKTATFKKLMTLMNDLTDLIMAKVDEAVVKYEKHPTVEGNQSVLEKLLKVDKNLAVVMSLDMISAGVDTTSSAVSGILYCLAKDPARQARLREELRAILPQKDSPLTGENMHNLPYLRACIKEGLRLYQPTMGNIRSAGRDIVLQGYRIPKGTEVAMLTPVLQRDQTYFDQPEAFLPERWLTERPEGIQSAKDSHPFIFLPFGFGARSCIGKRMAMMEMEIIVARLVRQFELRWNYEDLKMETKLISVPVNPLQFELTEVVN
uniref:Cytochrome P450 n=1 Tax=Anopheles atroparvus TaxID=41427 RepID=A0AAG5DB37_ANOAO